MVLLTATAGGLYLCWRMAMPFLAPLAWALALAVLFAPCQAWLERRLRPPGLAAGLAVFMIGVMVILPAVFVGQQLMHQAGAAAGLLSSKLDSGEWQAFIQLHPRLGPLATRIGEETGLPGSLKSLASWLSPAAGSLLRGSLEQLVSFCLVFYLLFFFLRDRHAALLGCKAMSPLTSPEMDRLFRRVGDTIHATLYGTLAVSSIQGLLGGLMFRALGLPGALLWGIVMALLAIVPVLGAFIVWIPAAVFLALEGHWGKALILTFWGIMVIGTVDNLLRPILVGNRLRLHTVLSFISIVGGLLLVGPFGIILGPLLLTVTLFLLELWPHRTARDGVMRSQPEAISRFENEGGHPIPDPLP